MSSKVKSIKYKKLCLESREKSEDFIDRTSEAKAWISNFGHSFNTSEKFQSSLFPNNHKSD